MSDNLDGIQFSGTGLNSDDDLNVIPAGDSRWRLNVTVNDDGSFNVLSNTKGSRKINLPDIIPGSASDMIGFVEDVESQSIIFFFMGIGIIDFQNVKYGRIINYSIRTDTYDYIIDEIQESTKFLNFEQYNGYVDASIIGSGDNKYLLWTDGVNPPRSINVVKALNKYKGQSPAYDGISEDTVSFYKKPLLSPISASYGSDSSFDGNNLSGDLWQFAVRLKYEDNSFSAISSYSPIPIPNLQEGPASVFDSDKATNNKIDVSFSLDYSLDLVVSYQLLFKRVDVGSGATGSWSIYSDYDYVASGVQSVSFYNDKNIGAVSSDQVARLYDFVPDVADHLGLIDSNRAVWGGVTEGFGNVDYTDSDKWDVSLESELSFGLPPGWSSNEGRLSSAVEFNQVGNRSFSVYSESVNDSNYHFFALQNTVEDIGDYVAFNSLGVATNDIGSRIQEAFSGVDLNGITVSYNSGTGNIEISNSGSDQYDYTYVAREAVNIRRSFLSSSDCRFGIVYSYDGKLGPVQTSADLNYRVPDISESIVTPTSFYNGIILKIGHEPPEGATGFHVVYGGDDISNMTTHYLGSADFEDDSRFTKIKKTLLSYVDEINGANGYLFDYAVGDFIVVPYLYGNKLTLKANIYNKYDEYVIRKVDSDYIYIDNIKSNPGRCAIQIRRRIQSDGIFEEFSKYYPIENGFHVGNQQNQTSSQDCEIRLVEDFGSAYVKDVVVGRDDSTSWMMGWIEGVEVSLAYPSNPENYGRVNIVNEYAKKEEFKKIRWGGKFFDQGGVNFISQYDFDAERDLDDRNGRVRKINQIGDTLKVYQERKVTSFYLKTTSSTDADGNSTYVFSDSVMSIGRQLNSDYGCTHFGSYVKNVRNAYFFDVNNGEVVRDSPNGLDSIVDGNAKMYSYFKAKSLEILANSDQDAVSVYAGFDYELEMYLITFAPDGFGVSLTSATVGYHEPSGRWVSFYSFIPTLYATVVGRSVFTVSRFNNDNKDVYAHGVGDSRNNFNGTQYRSEVDVHANSNAHDNKIYNSVDVVSTGQWDCPDYGDVEITNPDSMKSRLLSGFWKRQEGVWRTDFLRDALNGDITPTRSNLINGRKLRGHEIRLRLHNGDVNEVNLRSVVIKSTISK